MKEVQKPEKFIKDLIPIYTNKVSEVNKLIGKLEKIKKAGLWWDSKVPKKNKVGKMHLGILYYNFSWLGVSNKDKVISVVKTLHDFYEKIGNSTKKIDQIMSEQGINVAEPEINRLIFRIKKENRKSKKRQRGDPK